MRDRTHRMGHLHRCRRSRADRSRPTTPGTPGVPSRSMPLPPAGVDASESCSWSTAPSSASAVDGGTGCPCRRGSRRPYRPRGGPTASLPPTTPDCSAGHERTRPSPSLRHTRDHMSSMTLSALTDISGLDVLDHLDRSVSIPVGRRTPSPGRPHRRPAPSARRRRLYGPVDPLAVRAPVRRRAVAQCRRRQSALSRRRGTTCLWSTPVRGHTRPRPRRARHRCRRLSDPPEHGATGIAPGRYVIGRSENAAVPGIRAIDAARRRLTPRDGHRPYIRGSGARLGTLGERFRHAGEGFRHARRGVFGTLGEGFRHARRGVLARSRIWRSLGGGRSGGVRRGRGRAGSRWRRRPHGTAPPSPPRSLGDRSDHRQLAQQEATAASAAVGATARR